MQEGLESRTTPMMRQYLASKKDIPQDCILLFRMGDFYEVFFDDAVKAAPLLEVALTKRAGVPMCGVPYHALDIYLPRLLQSGVKVAVAEQMEDPRFAKGIVKRAVTRIITPGTIIEGSVLAPNQNNFLASLCLDNGVFGLASLDVSTGDFRTTEMDKLEDVESELQRLAAPECLLPESLAVQWGDARMKQMPGRILWTRLDDWIFSRDNAEELLKSHFKVASLDGFGCRGMTAGVSSAGAILHYARENLRQDASHLGRMSVYRTGDCATIDYVTQRNLELLDSIGGDKSSTLLGVLDSTVTPMGGRLLREWILRPLRDKARIEDRLCAVEALKDDGVGLAELTETLSAARDVQRISTKINVGSAAPRDVWALAQSLDIIPGLKQILACHDAPRMEALRNSLTEFPELVRDIKATLVDSPSASLGDGGFVREGFNPDLDELRRASSEGKDWMARLQSKEQQRTGIKTLKIKFNNVFGYYIEISKSYLDIVPQDYIRKQTIATGERFVTPELKEMENKIIGAEEKAKSLELDIFTRLREKILLQMDRLLDTAAILAEMDVLASLANCAAKNNYCRPAIRQERILNIQEGRHPVLDVKMTRERFVPNDTALDDKDNRIMIITGPNMAGKSTYIRQVALIVIMAQIGSFVPAKSAEIAIMDRIFTRVGASDDISRGQSTFMVEMTEAANILNNATADSLVVLDEIGRGTSTFDGISIAWAVAEYLHDSERTRPLTLFATHYHELTELSLTCKAVKNYNVAVKEYGDQVIFLRKILPGATDKSYGVHVAKIAGLPQEVIDRAFEILENLENNSVGEAGKPSLAIRTRTKRKNSSPEDDSSLFDWAKQK